MRDVTLEPGWIDPSEVSRRYLLLCKVLLSERKAAEDRPMVRQRRVYHVNTVDDDRIYVSPSPECDHGDELVDIRAVADNNHGAVTSIYKLHCHAGCGNKT